MSANTLYRIGLLLLAASTLPARFAAAQSAPFYQGKTIRIVVGFTPGGLYDQYARILARNMPKHIPGAPAALVQNMPGAGSLTAMNYVYNVAKPDGLTLAMVGSGIYLDQLLGRSEVQFDMSKINYVGSVDRRDLLLYMKSDTPWKSIEDVIGARDLPKCGATGTSDLTTILANVLDETLGARLTVVRGYPGGAEIDLAIEKGEIQCRGTGITTHFAREPYFTWHKNGFDRHLLQTGAQRDPRLPEAATLNELMEKKRTTAIGRNVARLMLVSATLGRPLVAAPGIPPERVQLLRDAYLNAFREPEVVEEAKKKRLELTTLSGAEVQRQMLEAMNQPREVIERVRKLSQ
ncbi:MAG TPA: tripartite tricarboxylate transporter substrate-binding protein [candidate division Zixibacteria bacterium]|nr:tripartite tricarboxylate transporter substrate-binding protein [candidate division Zixibacteria bacterium]